MAKTINKSGTTYDPYAGWLGMAANSFVPFGAIYQNLEGLVERIGEWGADYLKGEVGEEALNKGANGNIPFWSGAAKNFQIAGLKGFGEESMLSLSIGRKYNVVQATLQQGKKLTKDQLESILGPSMINEKIGWYDNLLDQNSSFFGFDSSGTNYDSEGNVIESPSEETTSDPTDIVDKLLMTDPYGERANQYRNAMYNSINQYEQDVNATLASTELDAYRLLGQQQLELENQIASQRMQAIKSGVTSAQLASQELANMFAAQSAASQIAQQTMGNRAQQYNTIAQQRASVEPDLYNMINSNQATGANVYAQLYAAQQSYNSYMNQPFASYQAAADLYNKDPDAYSEIMGLNK